MSRSCFSPRGLIVTSDPVSSDFSPLVVGREERALPLYNARAVAHLSPLQFGPIPVLSLNLAHLL